MLSGFIALISLCLVELAGAHFVLRTKPESSKKQYEKYEDFFYEKRP
ncbi:hypothetical protein ACJROX_05835 [Pseudalkalibacillus sp. A8]